MLYRFHAVHNAFSGEAEICGIAADWTYTENATILATTAKDITRPDIVAYGKVLGPVTAPSPWNAAWPYPTYGPASARTAT